MLAFRTAQRIREVVSAPEVSFPRASIFRVNTTRERQTELRNQRTAILGHTGAVVWLTGLSGAGKSTLARGLERELLNLRIVPVVLDGDGLREGLCRDLGFTAAARQENIRRAGEAAGLLAESGLVVIAALISPFRTDRERVAARCRAREIPFAEVFVSAPLAVCERRDPKHLYQRARAGEIPAFTGISSPYEAPDAPDLTVHTDQQTVEQSVSDLLMFARRVIGAPASGR